MLADSNWEEILSAFGILSAELISESLIDPGRRVYYSKGLVYKLVFIKNEISSHMRSQDLAGEFSILKKCKGMKGVPSAIYYKKTNEFEAIIFKYIPGDSLSNLQISSYRFFIIVIKLSLIIISLSIKGISHNDIVDRNILVSKNNAVFLIDFDQASICSIRAAVLGQFLGIRMGGNIVHSSVISLVKKFIKNKLPPKVVIYLQSIRSYFFKKSLPQLPIIEKDAKGQLKILRDAWKIAQISDANSPGQYLAYYSLTIDKYYFPGERPWIDRWNLLKTITDYSGKRILELGCNMALLSTYLLKYEHVKDALAVDYDKTIIKSAEQIALSFGVKPTFKITNFDDTAVWETELAEFNPDIVFALNVLNWVRDKQRFLNFLGRFNILIFEGHEKINVECERLRSVGFNNISIVSISERGREVLYCRKN